MYLILLYFFLSLSWLGEVSQAAAHPGPRRGRYAGYTYFKNTGFKIPTTLDTVHIPAAHGQKAKMAAYLKMSFGGFRSHEYITHYYMIPDYDWNANVMILDAVATSLARDITVNTVIDEDGEHIKGVASSQRGGVDDGEIELYYLSPTYIAGDSGPRAYKNDKVYGIFPDVPVYPLLTGSYSGEQSRFRTLQFEMTREAPLTGLSLLPLEGYIIRGRVLGEVSDLAQSLKGDAVIYPITSWEDIQYNPFRAQINFPRIPLLGLCRRVPEGIKCESALFKTVAEDKSFTDMLANNDCSFEMVPFPPSAEDGIAVSTDTLTKDLSGSEYRGYIHMEDRSVRRPFSINVNVTGAPVPDDLTIAHRDITFRPRTHVQSADPNLQWSRFYPIDVAPIRLTGTADPIVMNGPTGDTLKIVRWTNNSLLGIYYSAQFARVGTFRVYRNELDAIPIDIQYAVPGSFLSPAKFFTKASDLWKPGKPRLGWSQWQVDLEWITNANPFAPTPHTVGGMISVHWDEVPGGRNELERGPIRSSRFDPFVGILGGDTVSERNLRFSYFMKLEPDEVKFAISRDSALLPSKATHEIITLRRDEKYERPNFPAPSELPKGGVYFFMPYDALLIINGQRMHRTEILNHRGFKIPAQLPAGGAEYVFEAQFMTGRKIAKRIRITPEMRNGPAVIVDFYKLQ